MSLSDVFHLMIIVLCGFLISRKESAVAQWIFWLALALRLACGLGVGWLYTVYYPQGGDTLVYASDGKIMADVARQDWKQYLDVLWHSEGQLPGLFYKHDRALFMSKLTSLVCLLAQDSYVACSFYFSFVSFLCSWYLVRALARECATLTWPAVAAVLFLPSFVFWSSGVIKESVAVSCLTLLVAIVWKLYHRQRLSVVTWLCVPLACWILWKLKYYYAAVFFPVSCGLLFTMLVIRRLPVLNGWQRITIWSVCLALPALLVTTLHPNLGLSRVLEVLVENYHAYDRISLGDDRAFYPGLEPTLWHVCRMAPLAFVNAMFRPWPWEAQTVFQWAAALENMVVALLLAAALTRLKNFWSGTHRLLTASAIIYGVGIAVVLALSTPNFGTLIRYRSSFSFVLMLIILFRNPLLAGIQSRLPQNPL